MGFFSWIKNVGGNILNGAKSIGGSILGGLQKARDFVGDTVSKARNIPILGGLLDTALKTNLPFVGQSLNDLGNKASNYIDKASNIGRAIGIQSPQDRLRAPD